MDDIEFDNNTMLYESSRRDSISSSSSSSSSESSGCDDEDDIVDNHSSSTFNHHRGITSSCSLSSSNISTPSTPMSVGGPTSISTTPATPLSSTSSSSSSFNSSILKIALEQQQQQQQQQTSYPNSTAPTDSITPISSSPSASSTSTTPTKHHHHHTKRNGNHHHHHHTKYVTAQQVANMVVLQPPIQDKVLPLLLIDLRSYEDYTTAHIEWSISMQIPEKLLDMSEEELIQLSETVAEQGCPSPYASPRRRSGSISQQSPLSSPRQRSSSNPIMIRNGRPRSGSLSLSLSPGSGQYLSGMSSSPTCSPRGITSVDPAAESILKLLESTCFPEKVFESKFQWRHLSHAVLFIDCDDSKPETEEDKKKKRLCRWLYNLLKREHRIKALSILKSTFKEFQRTLPFLVTNKRHKEFDFPTIINSFMFLGTHRMLVQPGGLDILMKKKLGVQYVLNCAHECNCAIPDHLLSTNQYTYMEVDLESEVKTPLSHVLTFEKVKAIVQFIEGARRHSKSVDNMSLPLPTSSIGHTSDGQSSNIENNVLVNMAPLARRYSIGSAMKEPAKLFIHCHEGRCRGVTICCMYFMVRLSWNLETALQFFRVHRPLVSITEPYMKWLQKFDAMMNSIDNRNELPLTTLFTEMSKRWSSTMVE